MEIQDRKIAVLVDDPYQDMELWYPALRLKEEGAEVAFIGAEAGKIYSSERGYPARAELAYSRANPRDFDAVLIPGGFAADRIRGCAEAIRFVCEMDWEGKLVASISRGAWVLCSAGILKGRRATCAAAIQHDLIHAGAEYVDTAAIADRNLITARGPDDLGAFCRALMTALRPFSIMEAGNVE
ncbi:MAG: type 1 glutamine amidotransferase domain-containing protein [Bryobacteraceae bacterium]